MKVLFYSAKEYEKRSLSEVAPAIMKLTFIQESLSAQSVSFAEGYDAISIGNSDVVSAEVIHQLEERKVKYITTRSATYDNVDVDAAALHHIRVAKVGNGFSDAVAEHTMALILALSRKLILANTQVHENDYTVDNLIGFNLNQKKVGIIGTGEAGKAMAKILDGFGCTILAYDPAPTISLEKKYNLIYTGLSTVCSMADIITIHLPLTDQTRNLIEKKLISNMKHGVMLINSSSSEILNIEDVIMALYKGKIGYLGLDVCKEEKGMKQLTEFENVLITPGQGCITREVLKAIATDTFKNLSSWSSGQSCVNEINQKPALNIISSGLQH